MEPTVKVRPNSNELAVCDRCKKMFKLVAVVWTEAPPRYLPYWCDCDVRR